MASKTNGGQDVTSGTGEPLGKRDRHATSISRHHVRCSRARASTPMRCVAGQLSWVPMAGRPCACHPTTQLLVMENMHAATSQPDLANTFSRFLQYYYGIYCIEQFFRLLLRRMYARFVGLRLYHRIFLLCCPCSSIFVGSCVCQRSV